MFTGMPTTKTNAIPREVLPIRAASGLYESTRSPRNKKAPRTNPYAALRTSALAIDR